MSETIQHANAFTTGPNAVGYSLTEVEFGLIEVQPTLGGLTFGNPGAILVAIHAHTDSTTPGTVLGSAMLTQANAVLGTNRVTFSPAVLLDPSETYFVVISAPNAPAGNTSNLYFLLTTRSTMQTVTPTGNGWSIANVQITSLNAGVPWTLEPTTRLAFSLKATSPTASITTSEIALLDSTITLSATVNDPTNRLGSPLTYAWTVTGVPTDLRMDGVPFTPAGIVAADTLNATYDTVNIPNGTVLTFRLTVTGATTMLMREITIPIRRNKAQVDAIVSHVARAIIASTVSAVASRIRNIASGGGVNAAGVNIGGVNLNDTNFASAIQTNAQSFATNSDAMKTLLGNSDVSFPLNGDGGGAESMSVWASGEYSDVSGGREEIDWDGELTGFHLGMDGKIHTAGGNQIVIGAALSALEGEVDYTDKTMGVDEGNYDISMTTITPYIGWRTHGIDLWASVGVGAGEVERTPDIGDKINEDMTQTSIAIGGGADLVPAGDSYIRLNGEAMQSEVDIDGDGDNYSGQIIHINRVRIAMELGMLHTLKSGGVFEPSIEIGARYDGGDGETGTGIELGGQLKYYSGYGFTADGSARVLLSHDGGYEEWGIQGTVRKQVGQDGQGLAFHLTPAYGDVNSGVQQLFAQGVTNSAGDPANNATTADPDYQMHLTTRLGYGIAMRNANGMLTPYTEMVLGTTNQYRMGINWKLSKAFNLTLLSEQSEQNAIRLQGAINF